MDAKELVRIREIGRFEVECFSAIVAIQRDHQIAEKLLENGITEAEEGFLMASYSREEFERFLNDGGRILVAEQGSRVVGYLLENPGRIIRRDYPSTQIHWNADSFRHRFERDFERGKFSYLDQIGVERTFLGKGVAGELIQFFERSTKEELILSAVLKEPLYNVRSHRFFEKRGYQALGHFFTPLLKGLRDVRSTVFSKVLTVK